MRFYLKVMFFSLLTITFSLFQVSLSQACAVPWVSYKVVNDNDWDTRSFEQMLKQDYSLNFWKKSKPLKLSGFKLKKKSDADGYILQGILSFSILHFSIPQLKKNNSTSSITLLSGSMDKKYKNNTNYGETLKDLGRFLDFVNLNFSVPELGNGSTIQSIKVYTEVYDQKTKSAKIDKKLTARVKIAEIDNISQNAFETRIWSFAPHYRIVATVHLLNPKTNNKMVKAFASPYFSHSKAKCGGAVPILRKDLKKYCPNEDPQKSNGC